MGFHDLPDDGQSQPGPGFAPAAGDPEKGLENPRQVLLGMPAPVSATLKRTASSSSRADTVIFPPGACAGGRS